MILAITKSMILAVTEEGFYRSHALHWPYPTFCHWKWYAPPCVTTGEGWACERRKPTDFLKRLPQPWEECAFAQRVDTSAGWQHTSCRYETHRSDHIAAV